jgi:hypothetical protein
MAWNNDCFVIVLIDSSKHNKLMSLYVKDMLSLNIESCSERLINERSV